MRREPIIAPGLTVDDFHMSLYHNLANAIVIEGAEAYETACNILMNDKKIENLVHACKEFLFLQEWFYGNQYPIFTSVEPELILNGIEKRTKFDLEEAMYKIETLLEKNYVNRKDKQVLEAFLETAYDYHK